MILPTEHAIPTQLTELNALLHHAAIAPLDDLGWLRVTGDDRVRWLNGMVTNSIQALTTGQGCYNFLLSAQGRIQGTATAFALEDSILLQTDRAQVPVLLALLDRFIIMDDVELADATEAWSGLAIIGPEAATLLTQVGILPRESRDLTLVSTAWGDRSLTLLTAYSPISPRFELWASTSILRELAEAFSRHGAVSCGPAPLETLRVLEGTPRYGTDIRNTETARDLPQETNQTRALHFAKGCYLGQEIVERIRSRGNVHRAFTGFRLVAGEAAGLPATGTSIHADGKVVGELTTVATIPEAGASTQIALGYIRRGSLEQATPLSYPGGQAVPVPLPFTFELTERP